MLIGTDPEFVIKDENHHIIGASTISGLTSTEDKVGCDGAQTPLEIRPDPVPLNKVDKLCDEIEYLIKCAYEIIKSTHNKFSIFGGSSHPYAQYENGRSIINIGCHIHFGEPRMEGQSNCNGGLQNKMDIFKKIYFFS